MTTGVQKTYSLGFTILIFVLGLSIRYWLIHSRYQSIIANHIEVSTPLNSWKRVKEGLYLQSQGINPYDGDLLHEAPLTLLLYKTLHETWNIPVESLFLGVDLLTAILLYFVTKKYMYQLFVQQEQSKHEYSEDAKEFMLTGPDFLNPPVFVMAAFFFNPYIIFNCVGFSTTVFHNCFLALFLGALLGGWVLPSAIALGICTMIALYPIVFVIPLYLNFARFFHSKYRAIFAVISYLLVLVSLKYINSTISGGDGFLKNVYFFILTVPDLQPNIGLFWYFFTEMFDHFRELFISSFQINATILYLMPLSLKFRNDPFLLTTALLFLVSIFKSYPCLGDIGFVVSMLPCFIHLFNYSQQGFLVGVIFLITSALGPILWHLWIYSNSANANFYFGVTLAFAIAQIFLVTDVLFAYLKREFCLKHGKERKINGKEALLILE